MSLLPFVLTAWGQDPSCPDASPLLLPPLAEPSALVAVHLAAPGALVVPPRTPASVDGSRERVPPVIPAPKVLPRPVRGRRDWSEARAANLERGLGFGAAAGLLWVTALLTGEAYDVRPAGGLFVATDAALIGAATAGGAGVVFTSAAVFGK